MPSSRSLTPLILGSFLTNLSPATAQNTPVPPPAGQLPNPPPSNSPAPAGSLPTLPRQNDAQTNRPPINFDPPRATQPAAPAPPPVPERERRVVVIENADNATGGENDEPSVLSGNVRIRYNGYHVTCDRATFDRRRHILTFEGRVVLDTGQQVIYADSLRANTQTQDFVAREGRTIIPAALLGPDILQPVLVQGQTLERKGNTFTARVGQLTTCDFPNPHYKFGFRQADFIPNNRIVLRDTTLYRYQKRVARVRYLVIPVRESNRTSIPPNVGRTEEEGFFVKFAIGYVLSSVLPGLLRIDLMEKKGVGYGFDQAYRLGSNASGVAALYTLNDRNRGVQNLNGRFNHQQYLGDTLATLTSDFQNNSYQSLSANSKTANTNITLSRSVGNHDSNLSLTQTSNDYTTNRSGTTTYTLTQTEHFGAANTVTLRLNGSDTTSRTLGSLSSTSGRTEQNGDLQANIRMGIFDSILKMNRSLKLTQKGDTGGGAAFSGTQRLPDLSLTTDTERFGKGAGFGGLLRRLPGSYSLGYGRFLENVTSFVSNTSQTRAVTTDRLLFGFTPKDKTVPITPGGRLALQLGGNFQQTVYREDAMQYILAGRSTLVEKLGPQSTFNFAYNYLRPYGGAPTEFRLDQTGNNNNLTSNLTIETYRTRLSLVSGYDIYEARSKGFSGVKKTPWQNLAFQLGLRPSPVFQTRFTTAYDINHGRPLDLTNRSRFRGRGGFTLDTSLRYDPRRYRFPQATEVLSLPLFSRDLTISALTGYNGITNRFDYQQYYLTQSFHDYELLFTYVDQPYGFRTQRGFNFAIRLKAFPALRPSTTGQFGTPLDTGGGDTF